MGNGKSAAKKGVVRSLWVDEVTIKTLDRIAKEEGLTANYIVNKLIKEYVDYGRARHRDSIVMDAPLLKSLLEKNKEEFTAYAKKSGREIFEDATIILGKPEVDTFVDVVKGYCVHGNWATYGEEISKGRRVITLKHNLGELWSNFMKEVFFSGLGGIDEKLIPVVKFDVISTGLAITLPV